MIKINHYGRLGNTMLQDIGASILAKKHNLKVKNYQNYYDKINLNLHQGEKTISDNIVQVTDSNVDEILKMKNINCGFEICSYFQTSFFVTNFEKEIKTHFNLNQEFKKNKVFVHIRLGDASSKNPGIKYYEMCLDKLKFDSGYISTDSIDEKMIHKLCEKYNLSLYENTPGNTILFAKNFDNLVLSGGTFSWWIGFLSQASNILYPKNYLNWHGDIFVNNNWNGISC